MYPGAEPLLSEKPAPVGERQRLEWLRVLVADDNRSNVIVFLRRDRAGHELVCAVNFSPEAWENYRFGVPGGKRYYEEVFNTDSLQWGGSGVCNEGLLTVEDVPPTGGKGP